MSAALLPHTHAALDWLLEPDEPAVRALALRDLAPHVGQAELAAARRAAHSAPPISTVLDAMQPDGWWEKPGPGYGPKYKGGVWALILLAQVGAHVEEDRRIGLACHYLLDHALHPAGQFSAGRLIASTIDCLQGNLVWALLTLGYSDPRLAAAVDWLARSVTGEGVAPHTDKHAALSYYACKCGPDFACTANYGNPCAWGATKVGLALAAVQKQRTAGAGLQVDDGLLQRAIEHTLSFLLVDRFLAAPWPGGEDGRRPPNRNWWLNGFPNFYISDLLQAAEAIAALGHARDARLGPYLEWLQSRADADGRWPIDFLYGIKTWSSFGRKGQPNKWITLRALRVLAAAGRVSFAPAPSPALP